MKIDEKLVNKGKKRAYTKSYPNLQNAQIIKHLKYVSHFVYDHLGCQQSPWIRPQKEAT